jgi:O-antigen/teichoic acid export membrane protein
MKDKIINLLGGNSDLIKLISGFFGANFIVMISSAISGLIVTRLLEPQELGLFLNASIILTFVPFLTFGINNGLNRQLPYLFGQKEIEKALSIANTAFCFSFFSGLIILILCIALIGNQIYLQNYKMAFAFLSVGITGACLPLVQMTESTFRTNNDFNKLSKIKFINSIVAIISIPLVYFFDFFGYLGRSSLLSVFYLFNLQFRKTIKTKLIFNKNDLIELFKIGMPIFILGYLHSIYIGLDKVMILNFLSPREMGLYGPALQIGAALGVLPTSIFQILYPRMCRKFGETGRVSSLFNMTFKTLLFLFLGLIPVFGLGWYLVKPFIELVLPKYVEGIPAARWMVITMYFWCLGPAQDVLTTIGKYYPFVIALIVTPIIYYFSCNYLIKEHWGLSAIAASFSLSMLTFNLIITVFVIQIMRKDKYS